MTGPTDQATRTCGTCSLCCKLPSVAELNKPIDTWCVHARPSRGGCAIYAQRPQRCQNFKCHWLAGHVGEEWFPARSKMVLHVLRANTERGHRMVGTMVQVDPAFPNAWRREPYYGQLRAWARKGMVVEIRIGLRFCRIAADGSEREVTRTRAWIEGRAEP